MSSEAFKFYPQNTVWEITFVCNMRCLHCGTGAGNKRPTELTDDETLALTVVAHLGGNLVRGRQGQAGFTKMRLYGS